MKERFSVFDLFLPGIVAGMIWAGLVLKAGDAMFAGTFQKVFPRQALLFLALALVAATVIGFVSLFLPHHEEEKSQKNVSSSFPSGGPDAQ